MEVSFVDDYAQSLAINLQLQKVESFYGVVGA